MDIELVPDDVLDKGVEHLDRVGEEVSSTLERRPSALVHCNIRRLKFLSKDRDRLETPQFRVAAPIGLPIERGLAGPGLLAETVVRRHADRRAVVLRREPEQDMLGRSDHHPKMAAPTLVLVANEYPGRIRAQVRRVRERVFPHLACQQRG